MEGVILMETPKSSGRNSRYASVLGKFIKFTQKSLNKWWTEWHRLEKNNKLGAVKLVVVVLQRCDSCQLRTSVSRAMDTLASRLSWTSTTINTKLLDPSIPFSSTFRPPFAMLSVLPWYCPRKNYADLATVLIMRKRRGAAMAGSRWMNVSKAIILRESVSSSKLSSISLQKPQRYLLRSTTTLPIASITSIISLTIHASLRIAEQRSACLTTLTTPYSR